MFGEPGTDQNGWGSTTLGKCCELNPRRPKDLRTDVSYSFVAMPSVDNEGHVDASIERPYSEICKGFTYFAENDVLFAKITPCMENGKGGIAQGLKNRVGFGSTEFHVLRPINGVSDPHWLYTITMLQKFRIEAEKVMTDVLHLDAAASLTFYTYCEMQWNGKRLIVSRTGYTGEDGFELYSSDDVICSIWDILIGAGVTPCGLGCRDTLRFEAGLPLYGHELADDITPLEAGLGIFVKLDKPEFIGKEALVQQKAAGLTRKIVGIELDDKAIPRAGYPVEADGVQVGEVTTGYRSISLDKSVCFAMVAKEYSALGTRLDIHIRKKVFPGTVCKKRFYETRYKK